MEAIEVTHSLIRYRLGYGNHYACMVREVRFTNSSISELASVIARKFGESKKSVRQAMVIKEV